jgi:AraC family transcriptional regulator
MTELNPPRFAEGRPMLLAGVRTHHPHSDPTPSIAAQWAAFRQLPPIPGTIDPNTTYGIVCGNNDAQQTFEYMCGTEVTDLETLPTDLGRMKLNAQRYAVFTHNGHISQLRITWIAIWNEWLPASGYLAADVPEFEVHDDRFDPETGRGIIEIWFPIVAEADQRLT